MGNPTHASGADHDLYRRPVDGQTQDAVQVVDDGSRPGEHTDRFADPARGDATEYLGEPAGDRTPLAQAPVRQRVNVPLIAAWVLVGLFLAAGLAWLTGTLPASQMLYDSSGNLLTESSTAIAMNLNFMGPFLFLFGLLGAFTLLTVQAAAFRRGVRS
ncbi:hypothetical protein LOC59_12465 [Arthrobacter sp. zg-Y916]|uniref:hypothetical protein n=1 Tax=Arthrobacter sp. zg-Y916 TaxID=2894190 RepID=UPI001E5BD398|nr:hypothetical protein [Arthrobacter sp. zg-Y916]MCC9194453.1 hypothetical protein [Arthrobacter sp. zg-Y916]